jgi:hypothetical protein
MEFRFAVHKGLGYKVERAIFPSKIDTLSGLSIHKNYTSITSNREAAFFFI